MSCQAPCWTLFSPPARPCLAPLGIAAAALPAVAAASPKPLPLLDAKASAASFDAEVKPLSFHVFAGHDYRVDNIKVGVASKILSRNL